MTRPRARAMDGARAPLATYTRFAGDDLLTEVVMQRMVAEVATRRHARTGEPVDEQARSSKKSTSKSAVSRRFVRQTKTALPDLMTRELGDPNIKGSCRRGASGRGVSRGGVGHHP